MALPTAELVSVAGILHGAAAERTPAAFPSACGTLTVGRLRQLLAALDDTAELSLTTVGLPVGLGRLLASTGQGSAELVGYLPTAASGATAAPRRTELDAARRISGVWPVVRRESPAVRHQSAPAA